MWANTELLEALRALVDQRRRLHRVTIAGDVPVSVDGVASTPVTGDAAHFSAL